MKVVPSMVMLVVMCLSIPAIAFVLRDLRVVLFVFMMISCGCWVTGTVVSGAEGSIHVSLRRGNRMRRPFVLTISSKSIGPRGPIHRTRVLFRTTASRFDMTRLESRSPRWTFEITSIFPHSALGPFGMRRGLFGMRRDPFRSDAFEFEGPRLMFRSDELDSEGPRLILRSARVIIDGDAFVTRRAGVVLGARASSHTGVALQVTRTALPILRTDLHITKTLRESSGPGRSSPPRPASIPE